MATTKFTKRAPKRTPAKDIEDPPEKAPARGKRSPSKGARGQRAEVDEAAVQHKARGTGSKSKAATEAVEAPVTERRRRPAPGADVASMKRATKKAATVPEEKGPSRPEKRAGARIKDASQLTRRETRKTSSPEKRAERAKADKPAARGAGRSARVPRGGGGKGKG